MIGCKDAVERLWSYLDRHLERNKELELEQHLGLCRHCCGELEFAQQVRAKMADGAAEPLPDDTRARLEQMLKRLEA
ncbi:MAG TPA: zf-HC2 domain-containing protein [Candidatus Limnocylindria bacterium]|nr:zf-HC2 domain-containing protein [Candidatus Limnocylindria bacterium]